MVPFRNDFPCILINYTVESNGEKHRRWSVRFIILRIWSSSCSRPTLTVALPVPPLSCSLILHYMSGHLRSTSVCLFSSPSLRWFMGRAFNYGPRDVPVRVHVCTTRLHRRGCRLGGITTLRCSVIPVLELSSLPLLALDAPGTFISTLSFRYANARTYNDRDRTHCETRVPCATDSRLMFDVARIIGTGEIEPRSSEIIRLY